MFKKTKALSSSKKDTSKLANSLKSNLNKKYKIDERVDTEVINDDNEKNTKSNFKTQQYFDKDIKNEAKNWKSILSVCGAASLLAANSTVYGSSSSLILYQTNNYGKIVGRICDAFSPKSFLDFLWKLLWILPFFIAFLGSFAVIYAIDSALFSIGYELVIIFLFLGINIISLIFLILLPKNRPNALINRSKFKESKNKTFNLVIFITLFLLILGISFIARYAWNNNPITYPVGFINHEQYTQFIPLPVPSTTITDDSINTTYALQIVFAGFLCGFTSFIPGLSGNFMLSVIGSDSYINIAFRYAFSGFNDSVSISANWAWSTIIITFIGLILGFVASAFFAKYLYEKQNDLLKVIAFACSTVLFIAVLLSLKDINYVVMGSNPVLLGLSIGMLFLPIVIGSITILVLHHKNKVDFSWTI